MKKKKKVWIYYLVIVCISLLPLFSLFSTSNLLHTHDGLVHLARVGAYSKALHDMQIPVRWAGDLNYGYGMPLFNFMYQVPYLVSSLFLFVGFGLVTAFKLSLATSFILSGIFMYMFAKAAFEDEKKALLVTVFYQFAPFRLVELLIRGSFGEVYTYAFFPLILFGLIKFQKTRSYRYLVTTVLSTLLLIISHNALSLVFFGIAVFFVLFLSKTKKDFLLLFGVLFLGLVSASFYWLPALLEHKYTYGDLFMKDLYKSHFPPFLNLLIPNFNNSRILNDGAVAVQMGVFHLIAIALGCYLLIRRKTPSNGIKLFIFSFIILVCAIFFMQPISKVFWQNITILRQFQFPWRLLGVVCFSSAVFSVSFLSLALFKKPFFFGLLLFLTIVSTLYYWFPQEGYDKIDENYYWNFPLNTTYYGETDVIWSAGPAKGYPTSRVEVIDGDAQIKNFYKKSQLHTFVIDAKTDSYVIDHTQFFPGWKVYMDGLLLPVQFQNPNHRGELTFTVPKGIHAMRVVFTETGIRILADILSIISLMTLIPLWFFFKKTKL